MVVLKVHPPLDQAYVITWVPGPAVAGQNWPLTTPGPAHNPPAGFPVKGTQGSVEQKGPMEEIIGTTL